MSLIDADEPPLFDIGATHEPDTDSGGDKGGVNQPEGVTIPFDILEFGNGLLPDSALEKIGIGGHRLHRSAASAFAQWRALAAGAGIDLTCTDSYRTLAQQKQLKQLKPTLSATPGRSIHGWGFAVDVSIGMPPKGFGMSVLNWLKGSGPTIGWHLGRPRDEPWHWVFRGDGTGASPAGTSTAATTSTTSTTATTSGSDELVADTEVSRGSRGLLVRIARGLLDLAPGDDFDDATDGAARTFQQANGLLVDGRVGPKTWAKLRSVTAPPERPTLIQGTSGEEVRWVQRRLGCAADGQFGPRTNATVLDFQRAAGQAVDGRIGPNTWGALTR
jgi:hypothetical protein